jgi:HPt (histidine-containing phosphotransfer) domain-containing protein
MFSKMMETKTENGKVCDFTYLINMMNGKKHLIHGIMDTFLVQIPDELNSIHHAITRQNYASIKSFAHTMKSSVSIMGISILGPILQEMEDLGAEALNMSKIKELNQKVDLICKRAIEEIEKEKLNYE